MEQDPTIPHRPSTFPLFSKHLTLQPMSVIEFANQSRKQFEDFIEAFRKRIVVEIDYANSLMTVSRSLDKYIQKRSDKTVSFICSAFQVENQQRAHQAKQLADSLQTEIYDICQNLCKQETNTIKKAEKEIKHLIKRYESLNQNLKLSCFNYEKANEKFDELVITKSYLNQTSTLTHQKKAKMVSKTASSISQCKQIQKHYISTHKQYNEFVEEYNKFIASHLNEVQTKIRQQITLEADCLRKLIVAEVSMFKNIEYDLINISKQMESLDTQKDLEIATNLGKESLQNLLVDVSDENSISDSPKQKRKSLPQQQIEPGEKQEMKKLKPKQIELFKGMMATSIQNIEQNVFTQLILHKKSKHFKDLIELRWNQLNNLDKIEQNQNLKSIFEEYFQNSSSCQEIVKLKKEEEKLDVKNQIYNNFIIITGYIYEIWKGKNVTPIQSKKKTKSNQQVMESPFNLIKKLLSLSHFYRLVAYSFIQSFRAHHIVQIEAQEKFQEIAKFLNALLTKSYKENDVFILRGLLFLLFTFYYIENNTKRHMASEPSIYKNSLWKKQDFWDAALFESTYEEMLNFNPQPNQTLQDTTMREKNLLFSQLAMFCHYMIMLGISSQNVRQIVGRFCKLYGMSDEQNRDLSKMITNTVKQYKEIILVNLKTNPKGQKTQKTQNIQNNKTDKQKQ